MAEEGKKNFSSGTAFIMGLLLCASLVLAYHAKQSSYWLEQLTKANQLAEENRASALMNKSVRLRMEDDLEKQKKKAEEAAKNAAGKTEAGTVKTP